jgi:cytochrome c oxidase assembly protein subunit 15
MPDMSSTLARRLALIATVLALSVVVLGAYVRLSDAGLGCPDWPGCYGHVGVPGTESELAAANRAFPERPVEAPKAWKEMVHRYFAGVLGLLIFVLTALAWRDREQRELTFGLAALVIFQALLGMWTVTLLLKPAVVTAHLLGGMATVSLLWILVLRSSGWFAGTGAGYGWIRPWATLGLVILAGQIALGGWTSANYAALACTDFPTCHGSWLPAMDLAEGFVLWRGIGVDYEYGVLEHPARVAIHFAHRAGALITFLVLGSVAAGLMIRGAGSLRRLGLVLGVLLLVQVSLGIGNVLLSLPLAVAVAHNGVAALLLMTLVALNHALASGHAREPVRLKGRMDMVSG